MVEGVVVGWLVLIILLIATALSSCTLCVIKTFRPQCSPGPAWFPDNKGNLRVVGKDINSNDRSNCTPLWVDTKQVTDIKGDDSEARLKSTFGNQTYVHSEPS